ncbi:MAG: RNA-binding transcriptional accessory protein [Clostridia bacterium]|nr:RNA-binding transcriptional accessory protein [Clostridia bacterium]
MQRIIDQLSAELNETQAHVKNVVELLDGGSTVPFIARYRKELTGSMDDQQIRKLSDRLAYLRGLQQRREEVISAIAAQEKLTEALAQKIDAAATLSELEDLYRPYKQKRTTRASIAKERGLTPLAARLLMQESADPTQLAQKFINPEKGVNTAAEALAGARDIIAERLSDSADIRREIKALASRKGTLSSSAAGEDKGVYEMYSDFSEALSTIPGYRVLAINRGEKEGFLKVSVNIPEDEARGIVAGSVVRGSDPCSKEVEAAAIDAWSRLIYPSVARELRSALTDAAAEQAIATFAVNLKPLLMQPPVKNKVTMGLDPGYRTGCKVAVVDETGKVLDTAVIYPVQPHNKVKEAEETVTRLIKKHNVAVIAIGNGTAGRETEKFAADTVRGTDVKYVIVSEAGASVYSASKLGAEEFPDYDVSLRSAVSIARRLQDPLAELVKIEPRSIGVGQYQHDMPQKRLDDTLAGVVEDCVNSVGVDLNTASPSLLSYVSGVNGAIAKSIVAYREQAGVFTSRKELLKVPKLGPKAYEQCAGFLRVPESREFLDNTAVHPESYKGAKALLKLCGNDIAALPEAIKAMGEAKAAEHCGIGIPTLRDIVKELQKPGRDPREELPPPLLRSDVVEMKDLAPGMELTGTVRNLVDFGAFVDIGVHQDGLVHISRICDRFIRHPSEVLKPGDIVTVWVQDVDQKKKRISLTMKKEQ